MNTDQLERLTPADWFFDVRDQLKWHIYRRAERAFEAGDAARARLTTAESIRDYQQRLRRSFVASLGGMPDDHGAVSAEVTGVVERERYRIEKLIYQSRPGVYVTSLLYVPHGLTERAPAVLFLCGHATEGKAYPEYQRVCQLLALSGFVVLAQDPIGQGERLSYWEQELNAATVGACTLEHDHAGAQCVPLGWAAARFFLHDARRSIDYLTSRAEVDTSRIGLTGNSGGGTQSCLLMLTDERIAAAAPGTFIMDRRSYMYSGGAQDAEQIWPGFTAMGYDHADVLLAMAPKPVCVLSVTDDFFPIEGTRRTVESVRHIWDTLGVPGMPELVVDRAGHAYTPDLAESAAAFFRRALMEPPGRGRDMDERLRADVSDYSATAPMPAQTIQCTRSGQVRSDFADARFIFEECEQRAAELAQSRRGVRALACYAADAPAGDEDVARKWLSDQIRAGRTGCDLNPRTYWRGRWGELDAAARVWWSQPDLMGHGLVFKHALKHGQHNGWTIAVWDDGTKCLRPHMEWIRQCCLLGRSVLVLDVSGSGALEPYPLLNSTNPAEFYGVIHKLADDLTWLGDSLCALRTFDVLRAVDMIFLEENGLTPEVRIFADSTVGRRCIYGYLCAMIDERIQGLDVIGKPPRWSDWVLDRMYDSRQVKSVILPGVLTRLELTEPSTET